MKRLNKSILLTRLELKIMKIVWEQGTATVSDVLEIMSKERTFAYTTILTIMAILERKGVLTHNKSRQAFVYRPLLSRSQATRNHVNDVIAHYFDEKPENLLAFVCQNEKVSFKKAKSGEGTTRCSSKESKLK